MSFINRLVLIGLLSAGFTAATTAQAGVQLFTAEWYTESFGNECKGTTLSGGYMKTPGGGPATKCTRITPQFSVYSVTGIPLGIQCNGEAPRCPISSTPTSMGKFDPLGGFTPMDKTSTTAPKCAPLSTFNTSITVRPAKGATPTGSKTFRIPPFYRNPAFFTTSGQPKQTSCWAADTGAWTSTQTRFGADEGRLQKGVRIAGSGSAGTTGGALGGFTFASAPASGSWGIRATGLVGQVPNTYPYIYSYTYATLRNDQGNFGPGKGPGGFTFKYTLGSPSSVAASIMVTAGKNKFGGTMQMLGAMTTKVCYWLQAGGGGCSLGENNWRYEAIGASATMTGPVTMGAIYTYFTNYYNTRLGTSSSVLVSGSRFPWTTGKVTLTAVARGPHKTVHYAQGYDNRNTTTGLGKGTIQLVSPVLTRWFGYADYETGGIGVLRIKFIPEPQTWAMLVAGASLLGVATRLRGR